jgi:hypothetical protein
VKPGQQIPASPSGKLDSQAAEKAWKKYDDNKAKVTSVASKGSLK